MKFLRALDAQFLLANRDKISHPITVVWFKLAVGNIHEKKFCGKKFSSQQATNHYKLLYFFVVIKFSRV